MKLADKYPDADDDGASLPQPMKIAGLHPLVWAFIVVLAIAVVVGYDHVQHADWQRLF